MRPAHALPALATAGAVALGPMFADATSVEACVGGPLAALALLAGGAVAALAHERALDQAHDRGWAVGYGKGFEAVEQEACETAAWRACLDADEVA
jgi:hypothetical protein